MHFGIDGQSGGIIGTIILVGAVGLVAFIVLTTIFQRAAGTDDGPPEVKHRDDEDEVPL